MSAATHLKIMTGPRCRDCRTSEQDCAWTYPCCADCSHGFATFLTRTCRDCGLIFDQPVFPGTAKSCPSCRSVRLHRIVPGAML